MDYKVVAYRTAINSVLDVKVGTLAPTFIYIPGNPPNINESLYLVCLEPVLPVGVGPEEEES